MSAYLVEKKIIDGWEMTKTEYEQIYGKPRKNTTVTNGFSAHKSVVETALNQGKPVPKNVLKDYPDLWEDLTDQ